MPNSAPSLLLVLLLHAPTCHCHITLRFIDKANDHNGDKDDNDDDATWVVLVLTSTTTSTTAVIASAPLLLTVHPKWIYIINNTKQTICGFRTSATGKSIYCIV